MTLIPHNYDDKVLVTAKQFLWYMKEIWQLTDENPPKNVIICYDSGFFAWVIEHHSKRKLTNYNFGGELYFIDDDTAIIGKFGVWAPTAVVTLEELIARGVKNFISVGTCGGLQKDIPIGDIVVCEKAIRDEGTSLHYAPASKYAFADEGFTKTITQYLDEQKIPYHKGTTRTTDAILRETLWKVKAYQDEGVMTVEMEASALFTVAKHWNVKMASLITISDSLADLERKPQVRDQVVYDSLEKIYAITLAVFKKN